MIYDLQLMSTTVAGAWGTQALDLGVGLASVEAFDGGVLPDPNASEFPVGGWMYRTRCVATQNGIGAYVTTPCRGDLRSGRKLDTGIVFMTAFNTPMDGTPFSVRVTGIWRSLLLLP